MDMTKKLAEATDSEIDTLVKAGKYAAFEEWLEKLPTDEEAQAEEREIAERTGCKRGSPMHLMITAFFAGVDAGADMMFKIMKEETKSPTNGATLAGQATS